MDVVVIVVVVIVEGGRGCFLFASMFVFIRVKRFSVTADAGNVIFDVLNYYNCSKKDENGQ
jgi:hypothetical protein